MTGLKYLGQTTQDPHRYSGSGVYWKRHLKVHGNYTSTEILLSTESYEELKRKGIAYSIEFNVVTSKEWANCKIEDGAGGNMSSCPNYIEAMKNRDITGERNGMFGRSAVRERNLKWYTNGNITIYRSKKPKGFKPGRIIEHRVKASEETKLKIAKAKMKAVTNDLGEIFESRKAAAIRYKVSPTTISNWIYRAIAGWRFEVIMP